MPKKKNETQVLSSDIAKYIVEIKKSGIGCYAALVKPKRRRQEMTFARPLLPTNSWCLFWLGITY